MYITLCSGFQLDTSTSAVCETVTQGEPHKHLKSNQKCEQGTLTKCAFPVLFPVVSESETNKSDASDSKCNSKIVLCVDMLSKTQLLK